MTFMFVNYSKGSTPYPRPCGSSGRRFSIWKKRLGTAFPICFKWQFLAVQVARLEKQSEYMEEKVRDSSSNS